MFQYRQVLVRLRACDSEGELARSRLMGREKLSAFRSLAAGAGWLGPEQPLPTDEAIARVFGSARRAREHSSPHCATS